MESNMNNRFREQSAVRGFRALPLLVVLSLLPACGGGSNGSGAGGTVKVQIGGEELATAGLKFPSGSEVTITDGWEIQFSHVLVTVGKVWLSDNPDRAPSDQSQTGDTLAEVAGPWAVDLHKPGTEEAAGGEGTATALTTIDKLDKQGGAPLAAGERYAFSFDFVAAGEGAKVVNFDDDAEAKTLYDEARSKGYAVYYVGTATFKGTDCKSSDDTYDFSAVPSTVAFKLGFPTPASYLNCQNQDNQGEPFDGEEYQRGVTIKENQPTVAQITVHIDHPLYSDVQHEPLLYFDQLAARLVGKADGSVLTLEDAVGVDPSAFDDGAGKALPWRACDGSDLPASKQRRFETGSVPVDPKADPAKALRDYRDFVHYVQSTQGHMNGGEGLCFAQRNYPSPQ
jgi:hypothetical protein